MKRIALPYRRDVATLLGRLKDHPWFVFLDSCADRCAGGRYDLIASDPIATLVTEGGTTRLTTPAGVSVSTADPFSLVEETLARFLPPVDDSTTPGPGALGYFAYDLGRRLERLPTHAARDIDLPEMVIGLYGWLIVVDHKTATATLLVHPACHSDTTFLSRLWAAQPALTPAAYGSRFEVTSVVQPEWRFEQYAAAWQRIQHYLREGDVYQVNLTQRFSAAARGDPWDAYLRLRELNPAPHSAYLNLPGGTVLSSSPERFLRIAAGEVETRPIKGTRPRGSTPERDAALAAELAASTKDRAENVMIVDLLRNDLGKHSEVGSVEVPALFRIESYAKVHHLVSTVRSRLAPGATPLTVLRDCFPGGSITGAPKLRAMEIIEELEPFRRSIYCGAIGYLTAAGAMDTSIAIRTLVCHGGRMYCWAGGGIVIDSALDEEYAESLAKASAMLEVFARAEGVHVDHQGRR